MLRLSWGGGGGGGVWVWVWVSPKHRSTVLHDAEPMICGLWEPMWGGVSVITLNARRWGWGGGGGTKVTHKSASMIPMMLNKLNDVVKRMTFHAACWRRPSTGLPGLRLGLQRQRPARRREQRKPAVPLSSHHAAGAVRPAGTKRSHARARARAVCACAFLFYVNDNITLYLYRACVESCSPVKS